MVFSLKKAVAVLIGVSLFLAISIVQVKAQGGQKAEQDHNSSEFQQDLAPASSLSLAKTERSRYIASASDGDERTLSNALDLIGITLHPGTNYTRKSKSTPRSLTHCKALVYKTLLSLPQDHSKKLKQLTLYFTDDGHRGLGGEDTIILRCQNVTDQELVAVFIHEIGHLADSSSFHSISWIGDETLKNDSSEQDFVSGYAMTDAYEDFAESYLYYVLHGDQFRELARYNDVLKQKYDFLEQFFFNNQEFNNHDDRVDVFTRPFDATLLPYQLKKFWTN